MPSSVLDASALLAYLNGEPGGALVAQAIDQQAAISIINWAETLSRLVEQGNTIEDVERRINDLNLIDRKLIISDVSRGDASEMARLRPVTRPLGLSIGDRACIVLGLRLGLPIITADRIWRNLAIGVAVKLIR